MFVRLPAPRRAFENYTANNKRNSYQSSRNSFIIYRGIVRKQNGVQETIECCTGLDQSSFISVINNIINK